MATCIKWAEERTQECNEWRDEGHSECDDWDEQCCDWAPCSWVCKLVTWVCVAFVWVANWVCIGWTWITTAVCVLWDIVVTVVNAVLVTLESIFGWVLSAIAFVIELIEMIPVLGGLIRWILNLVTTVFWILVPVFGIFIGLVDAIAGFLGIRPEKKLRVCTIILRDEKGNPIATTEYAVDLLQVAADILKRDCNVRLVPCAPFQYDTGFADAEMVSADWVVVDGANSDGTTLDVPCGAGGVGADLTLAGTAFQFKSSTLCFFGAWRRVVGYGAPVTAFIIRSIDGAFGCSLVLPDYITIIGQTPPENGQLINRRVLTHESGHACMLWHLDASENPDNLMGVPWSPDVPDLTQSRISWWQTLILRVSRHVTYF